MRKYSGYLLLLTWALFVSIASAKTIASVGNPDPNFTPGLMVNEQEAQSVFWTQTKSYTNVSIDAPLGQGSANQANPVYAYLTNRVGLGTTSANEIAQSVVHFSPKADTAVQLFSGLTLGPGTYYLTLWSPDMGGGGWAFATTPNTTVDQGVTVGASQYSYQYVGLDRNPFLLTDTYPNPYAPSGLYIPETIYADDFANEHLAFSVTGTDASAAPEPQSILLMIVSIASLSILWFKARWRRGAPDE